MDSSSLQYGAFGLLALVLAAGGKLFERIMTRIADRFVIALDNFDKSHMELLRTLGTIETSNAQRHMELIPLVARVGQRGRHDTREVLHVMQDNLLTALRGDDSTPIRWADRTPHVEIDVSDLSAEPGEEND